jgi:AraC-like DNA-binding protein
MGAMTQWLSDADEFVRGIGAGALLVIAFVVWRSNVARDARLATVLALTSVAAWDLSQAPTLREAGSGSYILLLAAAPVAGLFWLLVWVVFEDRALSPKSFVPSALLLLAGAVEPFVQKASDLLERVESLASCALMLHAAYIVARGWQGDLMRARRRARTVLFGAGVALGIFEGALGVTGTPGGISILPILDVARPGGGLIIAAIGLAAGTMLLQARPGLIEPARRAPPEIGAVTEGRDTALLEKLQGRMDTGIWRREGLTIRLLAEDLSVAEHRLRALINDRLGYRNFADFLNAKRIGAAKLRLANAAEVHVPVGTIAFDLGYGSLGPFNRAFKAATGATPTAWRRMALGSPKSEISPRF